MAIKLKADLWFPSIVWATLDLGADIAWLKQYSDQLRHADPEGESVSNSGGWQSRSVEWPEFQEQSTPWELKKFKTQLDEAVGVAVNQAGFPQLHLNNMWFNINHTGCYNSQHTHPGCPLAGVLWIDFPQNSGEFTFHHHDNHSLAELQVTTWSYEPTAGMMMLFPGSLAHHVDENRSREPRYSLAFNLYDKY